MKKLAVIAILLALFGPSAVLYAAYSGKTAPKPVKSAVTLYKPPSRSELLALVNAERAKYGVAPLKEDPRLDQSAQDKADDEVIYNYFGHVSPHDGKQGYLYMNTVGIHCTSGGENLTENEFGGNTSLTAVISWTNSPPHHKAMINPDYTLTGFGINGNQIVEHFCQQ